MSNVNSYDVIRELDPALRQTIGYERNYYVLGGIVTSAITHEDTHMLHDARRVLAAEESALPLRRDNGTLRDIDILIKDRLEDEEASLIVKTVREAVRDKLEVSVFGLDEYKIALGAIDRVRMSVKDWTSRRTLDSDGTIRQELYPISQELPARSFEPYHLVLPDSEDEISMFSPAGHMLAYKMRSISGERYKDREKIAKMEHIIYGDEYLKEQFHDGPFEPWQRFASAVSELRYDFLRDKSMLRDEHVSWAGLLAFMVKSRALGRVETHEGLIHLAQSKLGEKILKPFVGNK